MIITKKAISRRSLLRGLGAAVALPLLDAMVPAATALGQTPARPVMRFGAVYVPNGVTVEQWFPETDGKAFEFTRILRGDREEPSRRLFAARHPRGFWYLPTRMACTGGAT